jgi:hypothetical protein
MRKQSKLLQTITINLKLVFGKKSSHQKDDLERNLFEECEFDLVHCVLHKLI